VDAQYDDTGPLTVPCAHDVAVVGTLLHQPHCSDAGADAQLEQFDEYVLHKS
jgi:hypothetical protein